jgi:hypothetical protein
MFSFVGSVVAPIFFLNGDGVFRFGAVKKIRDVSIAMQAYARQANNHDMEADAIEIRMGATRRMDQMRQEQKATIGLNTGARGVGNKVRVDQKPTLAEAGIDNRKPSGRWRTAAASTATGKRRQGACGRGRCRAGAQADARGHRHAQGPHRGVAGGLRSKTLAAVQRADFERERERADRAHDGAVAG